jgi:hypothetical protein
MRIFKTTYLLRVIQGELNPFTGTTVKIFDDYLECKQRNSFLISVDTSNIYFKNVIGVSVDKHLFGSDVVFRLKGDNNYVANGFWKKEADKIKDDVKKAIKDIEANANKQIVDGINNKINQSKNERKSVVQELKELKELFDNDVLTKEEFEQQKKIILNQN